MGSAQGPAAGLVWITRAQPGAAATAARVTALGRRPLVAPLIATRPLEGVTPPDLATTGALAFTSGAAIRALAALTSAEARAGFKGLVFTVGDATAAAARAAGFADVHSADGDAAALARLIAEARDGRTAPWRGPLIHPCAREAAAELPGATRAPIYETLAVEQVSASVAMHLAAGEVALILVQSPSAAHALARLARGLEGRIAQRPVRALSPACAAPLRAAGFGRLSVAAAPREADLLAEL